MLREKRAVSCPMTLPFWAPRVRETFTGSFSAASTPIFASKYSLESSWRDLQDLHTFAPLRSQHYSQKSSTFFREWMNEFPIYFIFCVEFCNFFFECLMNFCPDFATNSRKERRVSLFQSNLPKQIRKLPKILNFVKINLNYSILFNNINMIHSCP